MDSAASASVIPLDVADGYALEESEGSKADQFWTSATGELIPNLGQRTLACLTREGTIRSMTYQAAQVEKPLNAVCDLMRCKHTVVFDDEGSFMKNKETGEINWLRKENGNFMLDIWALPPKAVQFSKGQVFGRQP